MGISAEARDLLAKMLNPDPVARLSATEALRHPWITGSAHVEEQHGIRLETTQTNHQTPKARTAVAPASPRRTMFSFLFDRSNDHSGPR